MRATASRLAGHEPGQPRRATPAGRAMHAHDVDALVAYYADRFVYDDRRRLTGDPIDGHVATCELRSTESSSSTAQFEWRTLAVRGERLHLGWTSAGRTTPGYETAYLHVLRDRRRRADRLRGPLRRRRLRGRLPRARAALLRRRGRGVRRSGRHGRPSASIALNQGDFDRMFSELSSPDLRRREPVAVGLSGSLSGGASRQPRGAERDGRLGADVALGGALAVADRASSRDASARPSGGTASSTRGRGIYVVEFRDGRITSACQFERRR